MKWASRAACKICLLLFFIAFQMPELRPYAARVFFVWVSVFDLFIVSAFLELHGRPVQRRAGKHSSDSSRLGLPALSFAVMPVALAWLATSIWPGRRYDAMEATRERA